MQSFTDSELRDTSHQDRPGAHAAMARRDRARPAETLVQHPNFILRLGGVAATLIDGLCDGSTAALVDGMERLHLQTERMAAPARAALDAIYPTLTDRKTAKCVLDLRRDLFNLRRPRDAAMQVVLPHLRAPDRESLAAVVAKLDEIAACASQLPAVHAAEVGLARRALPDRFRNESIRGALMLSNPRLHDKLSRLLLSADSTAKAKESAALEISLLSYLFRASRKTSPYSSFGLTVVGTWAPSPQTGDRLPLHLPAMEVRSRFSLRHAPIRRLLGGLLEDFASLGAAATLRLNPTLCASASGYEWTKVLTDDLPEDLLFGTRHGKARGPRNAAIALLVSAFDGNNDQEMPLCALMTFLRAGLAEPLKASAGRVVQRGLSTGLLLATVPQGGQSDVLEWAEDAAGALEAGRAAVLRAAIAGLRDALRWLATGPRAERSEALRRIDTAFDGFATATGGSTSAALCRPMIHEDCGLEGASPVLDPRAFDAVRADLERVLGAITLFGGQAYGTIGFWLAGKFVQTYGETGICSDPVRFLTNASDELAQFAGRQIAGDELALATRHPLAQQIEQAALTLSDELARRAESGLDIEIDADLLSELVAKLPAAIRARRVSHCINGQFFRDGAGERRFVINRIYPGATRMLSRFLPDSPDVRRSVALYLERISRGGRYAAIPGTFGFNANLHPQLAAQELELPPFERDFPQAEALPLDGLQLRFDRRTQTVGLTTPDGSHVEPLYLAILNSAKLPHLHRMLDGLNGCADGTTPYWRIVMRKMTGYGREATILPRISLGSILIARRTVYAPKGCLPSPLTDDAAFFRALRTWSRSMGLPREVFFHRQNNGFDLSAVQDRPSDSEKNNELRRNVLKTGKPMYLDFDNPVSVQIFQKNLAAYDYDAVFAECLPAKNDAVVSMAGAPYVSEFSFELTRVPEHD